jgi:hypothetical protein
VFIRLIKAAVIASLHCGDQLRSRIFHISTIEENWRVKFKQLASQDHSLMANSHSKKIWKDDSTCLQQKLHIEGIWQPLINKFSLVGTFSCINLQTIRDLEGGISGLQIDLAQCKSWNCWQLKI